MNYMTNSTAIFFKKEDNLNARDEAFEKLFPPKFEEEPWDNPIPLPEGLPSVAKFENDMLPSPLMEFVLDIADRMQIPPDFTAAALIVVLSSLIGRKVGIMPKQMDDWIVVPNLWGIIVGRPALLKSPSISEAMKPLEQLVNKAMKKHEECVREFSNKELALKAIRGALEAELKKAAKSKDMVLLNEIIEGYEIEDQALPIEKRYKTEDATTQKIGEILVANPNGLLIHRDELVGWLKSLDREGREGDRAFFLESWNGNGSFTVDTISRGTLHIPALCLSILGGIQPGPLSAYVYQAVKGGTGDDGLMQRFQLTVWPDAPKAWINVDRWPDTEAKQRVYNLFDKIDGYIHHLTREDLNLEIPAVHFSKDAQEVFNQWREMLEPRLRNGELSPSLEAHLSKYRSLLPALAIIFQVIKDIGENKLVEQVDLASFEMAEKWCNYLETHAYRLYSSAISPEFESAKALLKKIIEGKVTDEFTSRDVYLKHWSLLSTPDEVERAVKLLMEFKWLRSCVVPTQGRPKILFKITPYIKSKISRD